MKIIDRKFLDTSTSTCHASTIVFDHEPIFAWFGGAREGDPDSSIYIQYKGKVKSLGKNVNMAYWNPVLFKAEDRIYLSYKIGIFCDRWQTFIIEITDLENIDDLDKLEPQIIPAGLNFCVKTKPIVEQLEVSEMCMVYCGSSVETTWDWTSYIEVYEHFNGKFTFIERSKPLTIEKKKYKSMAYGTFAFQKTTQGIIQPSLWIDKDGKMQAFFRGSRGLGKIYHSYCNDTGFSGASWTKPEPTKIPNPNASVDTVYFNDRLFLVYNPSHKFRYPLVVSELNEEFETINSIEISHEPDTSCFSPEFSYPYLVEHNGELHLTYTHERTKIEHVQIEVD